MAGARCGGRGVAGGGRHARGSHRDGRQGLTAPCRSEPARDSGKSATINVDCATIIASRLTPTGDSRVGLERGHLPLGSTGVPLGRFAATMRALTVTA
ncbi:hypothetical protein FE275_00845 [Pseudomonas koreensis]|nr:hypothetical protein FE275_00845 [Pseudomonas koreensis]